MKHDALLDGKPRSADATALEDSALMVVERKHFLPFLLHNPQLMERVKSPAALERLIN